MASLPAASGESAPIKDLYSIGEIPPLGRVPPKMHAWVIRRDRHGDPSTAMQREVLPTPQIGADEVLVMVMAAGINYNGIWACLGKPVSVLDVHRNDYHVAGSDAAGIVWAVGDRVKTWRVGDEVVVHCNQDDGEDDECNGGDPMLSPSQRIWGFETPHGSFAQFTVVQARQLLNRPRNLTWEESASYMLTLATAYRMLLGHPPHIVRPGSNVLVWGAAGGLGSMAIQLVVAAGGSAVGVISDEKKRSFVMSMGAKGVIDRTKFNCWGTLPPLDEISRYEAYIKEVRRFGRAIWDVTGNKADVDLVVEHPGETTFPVSCFVVKRGGMVVICAGTTGYNLTMDARFIWMRQKRVQGSHFATLMQASQANKLVSEGRVRPILSETFKWENIPNAHMIMMQNRHAPGNMAALVQASAPGSRSPEA